MFGPVDGDFRSGVLRVKHPLVDLDLHWDTFALIVPAPRAHRDDHAFLRLLLRSVRENNTTTCLFFARLWANQDAIAQRCHLRCCERSHALTLHHGDTWCLATR